MSYKLDYWNIPGRGEPIRLMLTIGGFEFTNDFVPLPVPIPNPPNISPPPFDDGTWAKLKSATPWGFLPTLTLPDGTTHGQIRAIVRYLGKAINKEGRPLYPSDPKDALLIDAYMDAVEDIWPIIVGLNGPDSLETAPLYNTLLGKPYLTEFLNERMKKGQGDLAAMFDNLENNIAVGPYILGERPSCADVFVFAAIGWWGTGMFPGIELMVEGRPKLESLIKKVGGWSKIKDYYKRLKDSRKAMPEVGVTDYTDYYKVYHELCEV